MTDPSHPRIFIPSDVTFQRHIIQAYHDSPIGMHRGRDASYTAISRDFYWRNLSKHVRNWVRRFNHCIRFKSLNQPHGPMQIRLYHHPSHTLGIDFVGELPASASGNKWILTAVCPFSNFLGAIPVPNKLPLLPLVWFYMKYSSPSAFLQSYRVIMVVNFLMQLCIA